MNVRVAKTAGFCFGVKRAVDRAFELARRNPEGGACTYGPIIHNPQVVTQLADEGVPPVRDISELRGDGHRTVIIRTHGVSLEVMDALASMGREIMDLTCPFVTKAQQYAKLLRIEGYQIIILGEEEHPEVVGIKSYAGEDAIVVRGAEQLPELRSKVGVVVQTTQQTETLKKLLSALVEHTKELKVYNTICNSTAMRLRETKEMAESVDVMVIVGGRNSANTTQLATLSRSLGVPTHHIETASELQDEWFEGANTVGITAGASTPEWIIQEVKKRISDIGGMG